MSGAILFIQEDLKITVVQEEVLVGCLSFVSLLGSLGGGKTSDIVGRKWTIGLAAIVFQSGAIVMACAPSFQFLMIGRLMAGVGIGFGGTLTSFPEIFINIGILLGYISNYIFSGLPAHVSWRIMLAVGILPSIFIAFALFLIPESPDGLLVLSSICENEAEINQRLAEIEEAAGTKNGVKYVEKAVWREFLRPSPALRKMLIVGIGIQCFQQITGIDATWEGTSVVCQHDWDDSLFVWAGSCPLFSSTWSGIKGVWDFYGDSSGMRKCCLLLSGNRSVCWVLSSEIYPLRLRAQAAGLGAAANRISSGVVAMSFLSVAHVMSTAGTFFLFSAISALSVVFVYIYVPETKGKSLEQIELMFQNGFEVQKSEVELGDVEHLVLKE
ncbi:unnamed protein product [Spirodela intermedia]|uniref:Uncharacterized protein n=1 Tax=Spirodela intermedia TaxID=51605 RepID=A0A7I8ID49_SPIIN|nr:unnamed protein product [Spirodela intermedia]CAA6655686.1 unnamed protein product [Spirodela intermedia]